MTVGSRRGALLAGALLAVALNGGCAGGTGDGGDGVPPGPTAPAELVTVSVSGGLAGGGPGVFVAVAADGSLTSVAGTGAEMENGELTDAQLAELTDLVESDAFAALPPRTYDAPAPDAFRYTVVHGERYVMADDASLTPPLDGIVALLAPWLSAAG
ncbi:hypothetical protein ACL02R_26165 [Streptomyces sp. MS19]|uniref:hypothetical protein n=1 Tax=Streptomyces sp. MS19 TaxID=3385972 RepID=UPI00399FFCDF